MEALNNNFNSPAISTTGVKIERDHGLIDARDMILQLGHQIKIRLFSEDIITRDDFGNIIRRVPGSTTSINFYAFPIEYNPTKEMVEVAGLKEKTNVIVYTAMLDWMDNNFNMDRLNNINLIKSQIVINNIKYEIVDKNFHSMFSDSYLYVVLGLNKV